MYYNGITFIYISERIVKSVRDQAAYAVTKANKNGDELEELLDLTKKGAGFAQVILFL